MSDLSEGDVRILRYLHESGADYPALVAGNTGLHVPLVERRLDALAERGHVEAATRETVYRVTEAGVSALERSARRAGEEHADEGNAPVGGGARVDADTRADRT